MAGEGGQSPGQGEGGAGQNPAQGAGGVKTVKIGNVEVPQDAFDAFITDRINEVKDSERGKYKDYNDLKKKATKLDEIERGQKSELDNLKTDLAARDATILSLQGEVAGYKLEKVKLAKLTAAGVSPDWLDSVTGSNEEEITASVAKIAARLKVTPPAAPAAAQGAGNPGIPPQPGQKPLDQQIAELEAIALKSGDQRDWARVNRLKAKKYQ